jgi:hypothetical protein
LDDKWGTKNVSKAICHVTQCSSYFNMLTYD